MVSKNSKLIKKRNQKTKKDKKKNKVVKSLKSNNKRKTIKSNKKIKKFTKKTKKNKRHKSQIGGTWKLSDQSVMGIEIEVCIHPDYKEIFKKKMERIENIVKAGGDPRYGYDFNGWEICEDDCHCPDDKKWINYIWSDYNSGKEKQAYNNNNLLDGVMGKEFISPKLTKYNQIINYVELFSGLFGDEVTPGQKEAEKLFNIYKNKQYKKFYHANITNYVDACKVINKNHNEIKKKKFLIYYSLSKDMMLLVLNLNGRNFARKIGESTISDKLTSIVNPKITANAMKKGEYMEGIISPPRAMTVKRCGIHIHWSNAHFDLEKITDINIKLFYKFHYMRIFYILERYFYKKLSEREIHGINGIYHTDRQFRGISPVRYFEYTPDDLKKMNIEDETFLPENNYWTPNNPETAFKTFNQFPKTPGKIPELKLYNRPNKILKIITKSFKDYMNIISILKDYKLELIINSLPIGRFNTDTDDEQYIREYKTQLADFAFWQRYLVFYNFDKLPDNSFKNDQITQKAKDTKEIFETEFNIFLQMHKEKNYEVYIPKDIYKDIYKDETVLNELKEVVFYEYGSVIKFDYKFDTFDELFDEKNENNYYLTNPLEGKNMIKFYDDKDMHIEFRFFANTKLQINKTAYEERLLKLFQICDKICYNVGLGIQELLKNESDQDPDLINKLQPNFFDDLTPAQMSKNDETTEQKEADVFDLLTDNLFKSVN